MIIHPKKTEVYELEGEFFETKDALRMAYMEKRLRREFANANANQIINALVTDNTFRCRIVEILEVDVEDEE